MLGWQRRLTVITTEAAHIMPSELPDIVHDTLYNTGTVVEDKIGRHMQRLKRYPIFMRRVRTRQRIGGLINRVLTVGLLDWGLLLALAVAAWGAITRPSPRR